MVIIRNNDNDYEDVYGRSATKSRRPPFINVYQHLPTFINTYQHLSTFINIYQHYQQIQTFLGARPASEIDRQRARRRQTVGDSEKNPRISVV
jgi:hypothetical protein